MPRRDGDFFHQPGDTVIGQPVAQGQPVEAGNPNVVMGVPYRVDPSQASAATMPWLAELPEKRQGAKIEAIKEGGVAAQRYPLLPDQRPCHDSCWIFPFVAVLLSGMGFCVRYMSSDSLRVDYGDVDYPAVGEIVLIGLVTGVSSLIAASGFLCLAQAFPACVVWTSLVFGPCFCIAVGIALIGLGLSTGAGTVLILIGLLLAVVGALQLFCVFFCWKDLIPFMIKLTEVVSSVINDNPMMIGVSLLGSTLGIVWSVVMGFAFYGLHAEFYEPNTSEDPNTRDKGVGYFLYFVVCLVLIWGGLVASNLCHVAYCGVFARWYLGKDDGLRLRKSLRVAVGPSFGSICLGSFLIAVVRALEATIRVMRQDQAEEGNMVACILLLIVECIISCIGDFMEYFSEWAYVQVAIRGCSFCEAVKITYSMCSCSNINYIIRDLLLGSVVNMGAMICAAIGTLVGGAVGWGLGSYEKAIVGFIIGFIAGIICGGTAVGVLSSGVKTILSLWAETPGELERAHPDIHKEFDSRIRARFC